MQSSRPEFLATACICALIALSSELAWRENGRLSSTLAQAGLLAAAGAVAAVIWRRRLKRIAEESSAIAADHRRLSEAARSREDELQRELARARAAAADAESRFLAAFDQAAVGMDHVALDRRFLRVNQRYCAITGYAAEDLLGLRTSDITHPDDTETESRYVALLLSGACRTANWEKRYIRKDGSTIWVNLTASLVRSPAGDPLYLIGVAEDVTARVHAQEALRQSEQRFRQLVEHAPFAIVVESGLRFRYLNPAAASLLGAVSPQQLVGAPILDRVHAEDRVAVRDRSVLIASGDLSSACRRLLRLDGECFPADVFPAAIVYDGQPASLLVIRDRSQEQERLHMEQRLEHARKMESVGRVAGDVAHEFNNHLTVINGYCDMLLDELASDDPLRDELGEIRAAAARAAGLTQQLLAIGHRQAADLQPAALASEPSPSRAAPARGSETVLLVEDQPELRKLARSLLARQGYCLLEAADGRTALDVAERHAGPIHLLMTGTAIPGMSGRELADRLQRSRPWLKVLYVSGCAGEESGPREFDTAAWLRKPFAPSDLAAKVREVLGEPRPRPRVLVIDDDAGVRSFLSRILADAGYDVLDAADGEAGLGHIERQPVELVITDLVMPGRDGLETLKLLRSRFPGVRVIAVSGAFEGEFLKAASLLGADAAFHKPIDAGRLLPAVRTLLNRER